MKKYNDKIFHTYDNRRIDFSYTIYSNIKTIVINLTNINEDFEELVKDIIKLTKQYGGKVHFVLLLTNSFNENNVLLEYLIKTYNIDKFYPNIKLMNPDDDYTEVLKMLMLDNIYLNSDLNCYKFFLSSDGIVNGYLTDNEKLFNDEVINWILK